jgi:hypothetical protein
LMSTFSSFYYVLLLLNSLFTLTLLSYYYTNYIFCFITETIRLFRNINNTFCVILVSNLKTLSPRIEDTYSSSTLIHLSSTVKETFHHPLFNINLL